MSNSPRNGHYVSFASDGGIANAADRPVAGGIGAESIDQVRDLLFGAFRREMDTRLLALERRVEAMELQIKSVTDNGQRDRKAAFEQLSRGVEALAEDIRQINRG